MNIADMLMVLVTRLGKLVMWISFMLFHLTIFVVAFFWLWITETTPVQTVTVQVVKTGITPPLATSDRFREAKTEPLHPVGRLHMRR